MKSQSKSSPIRECKYDRARTAKSFTMLVVFIFGHLLPVAAYATPPAPAANVAPPVQTQITAHGKSGGTLIQRNGSVYDVTTTNFHNAAGVNHFDKYNVGKGDLVNMHIPTDKSSLVNFIHGGRSDINGIVNAMKNGKIGGDIYFANRDGIVIGRSGVINAGSIHLSTPTQEFMNNALNGSSANIDLLLNNTLPISASGLIQVEGKLNATVKATIRAGKVILSGAEINSGEAARKDIKINYGDIVNVEKMETAQSIGLDEDGVIELFGSNSAPVKKTHQVDAEPEASASEAVVQSDAEAVVEENGVIEEGVDAVAVKPEADIVTQGNGAIEIFGSEGVQIKENSKLVAQGKENGGKIAINSDGDVVIEDSALKVNASASGKAGDISVRAKTNINLEDGVILSAAGSGANSDGGDIIVLADEETRFEAGAKLIVDAGESGNAGFGEISAVKTVFLNGGEFSGKADNGKSGTFLIDPENLTITEDMIQQDGSEIILEADHLVTIDNVLIFSGQFASGDIDAVRNGGVYSLLAGAGGITLEAPNIIVRNSQLVSGGDVTLRRVDHANALIKHYEALMSIDGSTITAENYTIESALINKDFNTILFSDVDLKSEILINDSQINTKNDIKITSKIVYDNTADTSLGYKVWEKLSEVIPDDFKFNNINFTDIEDGAFRTYENSIKITSSDLIAAGDIELKAEVSLQSTVGDVGGDLLPVALGFQRDKIINEISIVSAESESNEIIGKDIDIKASTLYEQRLDTDAVPLFNLPVVASFGYLESDLSTIVNIDAGMKVEAQGQLAITSVLDGEQRLTLYTSSESNGGLFFSMGWNGTKNATKVNFQNYILSSDGDLVIDGSGLNANAGLFGDKVTVAAISKLNQISVSRLRNGNEGSSLHNTANLNVKKLIAGQLISEELTNKFNAVSSFSLLGGISLLDADNEVKTLINGNISATDATIEAKLGVADVGAEFLDDIMIANIVTNDIEALFGQPANSSGNAGLSATANQTSKSIVSVAIGSTTRVDDVAVDIKESANLRPRNAGTTDDSFITINSEINNSNRVVDLAKSVESFIGDLVTVDDFQDFITKSGDMITEAGDLLTPSNFYVSNYLIFKKVAGSNASIDSINVLKASYSGYDYTATAEVNIANSQLAGNKKLNVNALIDNPVYSFVMPSPTAIGSQIIALIKGTALSSTNASDVKELGGSVSNEFYNLSSAINITGDSKVSGFEEVDLNSSVDSFLITLVAKGNSGAGDGVSFNGSVALLDYNTNLLDPNGSSETTKSKILIGDDAEITLTKKDAELNINSDDVLNAWVVGGALKTGSASGAGIGFIEIETARHAVNDIRGDVLLHNADQNLAIQSQLNGEIIGIAVAVGVGTASDSAAEEKPRIEGQGSIALLDVDDKVKSLLSGDILNSSATTYGVESIKVIAESNTTYHQAAGALTISLGAKGGAGFGGAVNVADIDTEIEANLDNVEIVSKLTGADVFAYAVNTSGVNQYTIAATVAGSGSSAALSGSVNILNDNTSIESQVINSKFRQGGDVYIRSLDVDSFDFETDKYELGALETRSNLMVVGGIAIGGKVAIGASVNNYEANKTINATLANSSLILSGKASVDSVKKETTDAVVVAGGIGGKVGLAGAVSVYNAGSAVVSTIDSSDVTAGSLNLGATNETNIDVVNVAVSGGATAGIAGSVVVNNLGDTTKSEMTGKGTLVIAGNVDIAATLNQTTEFEVAAAGVGGNVGVAGSVVVNTIKNNTSAQVGSGYTINNASNVSLEALSDYTRGGFVGAIAGGTVGVGAVVTVDDIQNTTNAVLAAKTVTISGQVDVQANSNNDFDLLALNISGGSVAIGATVNIVNFGGDISSATGELKGDNLDEYNTVVSEYNISADSGKTSAAIESEEITAGSINLVSKQDNDIYLESGGFAVGSAAIGVGVGVVDVKSEVESRIASNGDYKLSDSDGLYAGSQVDTDAEVFSYAGSVGGSVAINVRVSEYSSTASATTFIGEDTSIDLQGLGKAVVKAEVIEKSNVENISVAASGGLAASGTLVTTTHNANSLVEISDGAKLINSTETEIKSNILFDDLKAQALGISVGVAAGGILFSEVNIEGSKARLITGSGSEISGGSVSMVSDLTTEEISSEVVGVSVGLGALSVSEADVKVGDGSGALMNLGGNISATGALTINSLYSNDLKLDAYALGASGGLIGVSGGEATIINNGSSNITFGTDADISGNSVVINSSSKLQQEASATVLAGGAVGVGLVASSIDSNGQSHITLAGNIAGRTVDIDSFVSDVSKIDNTGGAGGLVAAGGGGAYNTNTMEATVTGDGQISVDAESFDLTAETSADFDVRLEMASYGLLAGAAGKVANTITQKSEVDLSAGVEYLNLADSTASIYSSNKTVKNESGASYQNTLAGLGGFSAGRSETTHTSNANIILGAFDSADNVDLTLKAYNDTEINDTVKFDSYLLVGGSDSKSYINSTNNTKIEFLAGDSHLNSLVADAYSDVDLTSQVRAVVSGLIAVDVTSFNSAISQGSDNIVFRSGAKYLTDKTAVISAGIGGAVNISNKSYSYNKSILPAIPDAGVLSSGTRNGSISIASGAEIRAGGDITISASHNELDVSGYALGHSIALEVLDDFVQGTVGWLLDALGLPISVKYEDEMRSAIVNNNSSVNIDGTIQSGLYNYYYAVFDADSGSPLDTINSSSLPGGIDPNSEYIKKLGFSVLADKYSASQEAVKSLAQLRTFIEVFKTRNYGLENQTGTYQQTYNALLQQEEFLVNILDNGLSTNAFSQILIDNLDATNGNIYINADVVSGIGNITVLEDAKVLIDNRSSSALRVGDIVLNFKEGGKVFFNDVRQQGSIGNINISSKTLASTHGGAQTPGISILGNTQTKPSPPIILDGRISYAGQNINITNEKGSVIGTKNMEIIGGNVRIAAGKDIILGLDNQNVIAPIIVNQNQTEAISNLLGSGSGALDINDISSTITNSKLSALLIAYRANLLAAGQGTTASTKVNGTPEENYQNLKSLLKLLTDSSWTEAKDNYSTELVNNYAGYAEKLNAIEKSSEHFNGITGFVVNATTVADVLQGVYNHVSGQTQAANTDTATNTSILNEINAIDKLADLDKWYDRVAIKDKGETIGYTFTVKQNGELSNSITDAKQPTLTVQTRDEGYNAELTKYNNNMKSFREAVVTVFGNRSDTITSTTTAEKITLSETLTSNNAMVAGENIFLSASAVNLNGHLQAGFDTREIVIDDALLTKLQNADSNGDRPTYTTGITADVSGGKLVYNELVERGLGGVTAEEDFVVDGVDVRWNADTMSIEVGEVEIKGGNITIAGQLFNTGEGNINVMSGYGKVIIDNQTDAKIEVGDIANNYISGKVTLIDTSYSLGESQIKLKRTEYYRELDDQNNVQLVKDVFLKTGSEGEFLRQAGESSITAGARTSVYNPKSDLVYTYQKLNLSYDDSQVYKDATTIDIDGNSVSIAYDFDSILSVDSARYNEIGESTVAGTYNVSTYNNSGTVYLDALDSFSLNDFNVDVNTSYRQTEYFYLVGSTKGSKDLTGTGTVVSSNLINTKLFGAGLTDFGRLRGYIRNQNTLTTSDVSGVVVDPRFETSYSKDTSNSFVDVEYWTYNKRTNYQEFNTLGKTIDFNHREAVLRASNAVNINFMGYDRGEVTVNSGGSVSIGNIANNVGDTIINSTNGGIEHRASSIIHSDDITITAGNGSIGTATDKLHVFQDKDARQSLNVNATENVYAQSIDGALEFDSLSNGANSELVLIAEGDLRVKNHTEANQLAAKNIYLESKSGELFRSQNIYTDIKAENGGVIIAKSDIGDIKLIETAGDLAVEKIQASGNVDITVRNGGLTDAQPVEERDEATIQELLALWEELGIEKGTAEAQARVDSQYEQIQEYNKAQYNEHWKQREQSGGTYAAYDADYKYELSAVEIEYFNGDTVAANARIEEKTQYYHNGAKLIGSDKSTASYDAQYEFLDAALKADIENKMTWTKDELTRVVLNFAYKETTDTVTEVEKSNILAGGDVNINADYVGINDGEVVLVETDGIGNATTNELHVETVVKDANGNNVTLKQATELAKLALLSAERNSILIDGGQDGNNAKLSVLQQEDFDIDAVGEISINTTGNTNDSTEHVYLGSEQDLTLKEIQSSGDVAIKSSQNIIASQNQINSHILYGDTLVLESANGFIGGAFPATGNYLRVETDNALILATDKVGLSARADGAILIQNTKAGQDLWIRDIYSRNGTVAIDANGSILDRDNFDYGGTSDSINIGASRVELTSRNGTIGDASTYGQIELNGDTVLAANAANGVFVDGDGELHIESLSLAQGDINITVEDALNINQLTTTDGNITLQGSTVKAYTQAPNYTGGIVTPEMTLTEAQITTSATNEVIIKALAEDEDGVSVDLNLAAQQGVFDIMAPNKVILKSSATNPLNISSILSEQGAIDIMTQGDLNFNRLKTDQSDITLMASTVKTYTDDLVNSGVPLAEAEITTSVANKVIIKADGADEAGISVDLDLAAQQGVFEIDAPKEVIIKSSDMNTLNISSILSRVGAISVKTQGALNINNIETNIGDIALQASTVKTYTVDLVRAGELLDEAQIITSKANRVVIKARDTDRGGVSVDLDLAAQQGVFEIAALGKVVIDSSTSNVLNFSTLLSDKGAVNITNVGNVIIGTVGTPTDLIIKSTNGGIDIDTIGGDFLLPQGMVHTPQSISLTASGDDSVFSLGSLNLAEEIVIQADTIIIGDIQSKDDNEVVMSISGTDGGRAKYFEVNATNNTPLVFNKLYSEDFVITTDNDQVTIIDGNIGNRGTITSNRYNIEVSSLFQPLGIYDYQLSASTNNFELALIGSNLYSSNYATYVGQDYIFNGVYRTDESALSLMEKLNAMSERDLYYMWYLFERELDLKKKGNKKRKLFQSHLEPEELSKL